MHHQLEREVKLGVWPGFCLPELGDVAEGITVRPLPDRRLEATYYDTPDARLARSSITLRFRTGDGSGWTLKFPEPAEDGVAGGMARRELVVAGDDRVVPAELAGLLTPWVRTSSLVVTTRLHTLRRSVELVDVDGVRHAEVVDDEVSVLHGGTSTQRFREVEVEISEAAPVDLLAAVVERLRAAGAGAPDPTPKVIRAMGPKALGPPEIEVPPLEDDPSAADVVRAGLAAAVLRIMRHEPGVRIGEDAEDVHQARVGTRRMRSDLRAFGPLLDPAWADGLREELARLAGPLGEVRDADVLLARLRRQVADLAPDDQEAAYGLLLRLEGERVVARQQLLEVLGSPRHAALLDRLVEAARSPLLLPESAAPAAEVLPGLVRDPWDQLVAAVDDAGAEPPDDVLHRVRIRAKRCRYAAEVAQPAVGKPARKLAGAVAALQDVLGDHHDAVVAEAWLRRSAAALAPAEVLVAGQLIAAQRAERESARSAWSAAWKDVNRKKLRAWLTA